MRVKRQEYEEAKRGAKKFLRGKKRKYLNNMMLNGTRL